jgi:hypothetical protein
MPVILVAGKVEIRRFVVQSQPGQIVVSKIPNTKQS